VTTTVRISIEEARSSEDIAAVKVLFLDYARSLDFDLCFQGFDQEMATFPGNYGEPEGALILARVDGAPAGAVGLRMLQQDPDLGVICEMKRLYVHDAFRGLGLGRKLALAIAQKGRSIGYGAMRLDTINTMTEAIALYRSLGFSAIDRYNDMPMQSAEYYQLILS
jgi:putative acetyltransferase